jgi:hypothetical protein
VFTVAGWITVQELKFHSHTENLSSLIAFCLTISSVVFPFGLLALYIVYMNPYFKRQKSFLEGRFDTLLEPVNEKDLVTTLMTVFLPMLREFVAAVTVTTMNNH